MRQPWLMLAVFAPLALAIYYLYVWRARTISAARLADMIEVAPAARYEPAPKRGRAFPPRRRHLIPIAGALAGGGLWLGAGFPLPIAAAIGFLAAVATSLVETQLAERQEALIETQLAAAIDLMVSAVRAGAGLLAAFESTLQEAERPLRPHFQELAGRIRLGDDPRLAVAELPARVPLETFQLFATSLAVHWEVGCSLATTLTTVARTVRDRIELSRRVRAQGVESHASVAVVLAISYVLGFLMWRTNPDRLEAFVGTAIGTFLVAAAITLQAVGLIWMARLSRSKF